MKLKGDRLGPSIACGAYAQVYEVEGQPGAVLKVPRPGTVAAILREWHILRKLDHPGIVRPLALTIAEGLPALLLPRLGTPSTEWPPAGSEQEAAKYLRAIIEAVKHAHARGVIHTDIRPENVLKGENGQPVLVDFGEALHPDIKPPTHGLRYYSDTTEAHPRNDVYGIGLVACDLILRKRIGLRPVKGVQVPPELSHWQPFFSGAMHFSPEFRYQTLQELADAIPC